ncbi:hypothetical protein [uncultured Paludibaculum sp.]|uniref:hypothetical protein n=1 Tax=uncultured Paludibaculum sp. TaxID=1765020 RepID=UPI002AAA7AD2|nr:hypothetical protein [uncultured Paludibaculum sp.]
MGQPPVEKGEPPAILHGRNPHDGEAPTAGGTNSLSPITNHGGPVMSGTITAYVIWYGNWNQGNGTDTPAGQQIVRDFLSNVGNSPYFSINTTYPGVSGLVLRGAEYTDTGSQGTRLTDSKVKAVVSNAITKGLLPNDTNGVYFVLTSSNVSESSGFCSRYCGWHTYGTISSSNIKYSFVGNASRCLNGCAAQTISPNGNAGVDGMISVIAHELEEAATDPNLNAWYDSSGAENADKCAWTFGSTLTLLPSGAYYNMTLGSRNYLIQRNLDATNSKCYVSLHGPQ